MAGKVMIEQSDLLIAIWDGVTPGAVGGTRHTMAAALNEGVPVLWIDAATPGRVRLLVVPEATNRQMLSPRVREKPCSTAPERCPVGTAP